MIRGSSEVAISTACPCCGARDVTWHPKDGPVCSYCRTPNGYAAGLVHVDLVEVTTIDSLCREYVFGVTHA